MSRSECRLVVGLAVVAWVGVAAPSDAEVPNARIKEKLREFVEFHERSRDCYRRFAELRQQAAAAGGQPLTPEQQEAAAASTPESYWEWLTLCMRRHGHEIGTAGETDVFGRVTLEEEGPGLFESLRFAITQLHERSHQESMRVDAETVGLDFSRWQCWGELEPRLDKLRASTGAPEDVFLVAMADPASFGGALPPDLQSARDQLSPVDIECLSWYLDHRAEIDAYLALRGDYIRNALEEVREHQEDIEAGELLLAAFDRILPSCDERLVETRTFRSCYPVSWDRQAIVDLETGELAGGFQRACDPDCVPRFDVQPAITSSSCNTSFGELGYWTDVSYTVRCESPR